MRRQNSPLPLGGPAQDALFPASEHLCDRLPMRDRGLYPGSGIIGTWCLRVCFSPLSTFRVLSSRDNFVGLVELPGFVIGDALVSWAGADRHTSG